MKQIHDQEQEQFKKLFQSENVDRFEDRLKVLEVFLSTETHITADDLVTLLEKKGHRFDLDFVKSTLHLMSRYGFARVNQFDNGRVLYEHRHLGHHHDHMICTKCKKIIEFENPSLEDQQIQIAKAHGFHLLQHRMELYGICAECLKERQALLPLSIAKQGERLIIREVHGGGTARARILSMGLRIGDEIEVISNQGQGQMVIAVDVKRFIIGRGMAEKIICEPVRKG